MWQWGIPTPGFDILANLSMMGLTGTIKATDAGFACATQGFGADVKEKAALTLTLQAVHSVYPVRSERAVVAHLQQDHHRCHSTGVGGR